MTPVSLDWEGPFDGPPPRLMVRAIDDNQVRWAERIVELTGVLEQLDQWEQEARKGPGGAPRTFPNRALLVAMVLAATADEPMHISVWRDILFSRIGKSARRRLEVPDPPAPDDILGWENVYRNMRTRFKGIWGLMDPSPAPKNRRLPATEFEARVAEETARRGQEALEEAHRRLTWFTNRVIEASLLAGPRDLRRSTALSMAVDATPIPAFARAGKRGRAKGRNPGAMIISSTDPDADWYDRTPGREDDGFPRVSRGKWAYELSIAVLGDLDENAVVPRPSFVLAMAPLHKPGKAPGREALHALKSIIDRGYSANFVAGDRAYSSLLPENFQLPARSLGYRLVFDYTVKQLGSKGEAQGFIQVEGAWYCPSMPEALINATKDLRAGKIDKAIYSKRIELRRRYLARPNTSPDPEGHQRYLCPAAGACTARCPLKEKSERREGDLVQIRPSRDLLENPPPCCTQETVTIPPEAGARFAQALQYASPEHRRTYSTLRNSIEGMNGFFKDAAFEAIGESQRRRVRGVAPQSIMVAFQLMAANLRKVVAYAEDLRRADESDAKPRRRRRRTRPLQDWVPGADAAAQTGLSPPAA